MNAGSFFGREAPSLENSNTCRHWPCSPISTINFLEGADDDGSAAARFDVVVVSLFILDVSTLTTGLFLVLERDVERPRLLLLLRPRLLLRREDR